MVISQWGINALIIAFLKRNLSCFPKGGINYLAVIVTCTLGFGSRVIITALTSDTRKDKITDDVIR